MSVSVVSHFYSSILFQLTSAAPIKRNFEGARGYSKQVQKLISQSQPWIILNQVAFSPGTSGPT